MKKLTTLSMLLFLTIHLSAQVKLDVDGDTKMRGQLDLISTGFANMFIGEETGNNITDGQSNVFLGWSAGVNNSSGDDNTFVGTVAGSFSKTGSSNTFLGHGAGQFNDSGSSNTFVGKGAGNDNTGGDENTFIGRDAGGMNLTGKGNTFLGFEAGFENKDGEHNTFLGQFAGNDNANGDGNTFVGRSAGVTNTGGSNNTFIGKFAGLRNLVGGSNIFIGHRAGERNTSGVSNTAIGTNAGRFSILANENTIIGKNAGYSHTEGSSNTYMGTAAGFFDTTGTSNTFIGAGSGNANGGSYSSAIAIGSQAKVGCSNCAVIGKSTTLVGIGTTTPGARLDVHGEAIFREENKLATFRSSSKNAFISFEPNGGTSATNVGYNNGNDGNFYYVDIVGGVFGEMTIQNNGNIFQGGSLIHSDRRFKRAIRPINDALVKIDKLQGVTYAFDPQRFAKNATPEGLHLGLIAQEVEKVFPQLVQERPDGFKAVNYDGLIPVLIEGMKEQQQLIKDLQKKAENTESLERQLQQQQQQINELKSLLNQFLTDKSVEAQEDLLIGPD